MSLKHRLFPHVQAVGQALLPVEEAAQIAAADAHRTVATMIEQRQAAHRAGTAADFGTEAIEQASRGADHLTAAASCFVRSHQALATILGDLGYGPQCPVRQLQAVDAA